MKRLNAKINVEKIKNDYLIYIDNQKLGEEYLKENYLKISTKKDAFNIAKYEIKLREERKQINITEFNNLLQKSKEKFDIKIKKEDFKKSIYSDVNLIAYYKIDEKRFITAVLYKNGKKTIELKEKFAFHNLRIRDLEIIE
jgi:predicted ATPase